MDTSRFDFETTTNTSLDKILNLEQSLKLFQAQVNRKLDLMEQIFLSRNEQLERQRRLLDREQAFYKALLQNWKVSVDSIIDSRHEDNSSTINQHFQNVNLKTEVLSGTEEVDFDIEDDWGNGGGPYLDTDLDLGSDPEYNPNKSRRTLSSNANRRRHRRKRKIPLSKSISNELDEDQSGDGQKSNTNTRRRSRTRKSFVWEYFQQVPDSHFAVCSICNAKLAMVDGSTGGMISHLKRKHSLSIPTKPNNNTQSTSMEVEVVNEEGGESSDAPKPKKLFIAPPAAAFPNPIPIAKPRAKKSFVWKYFTFLENENCAVCTFCNFKRTLKDGSTGGLIQHLKRKHFILNDNSIPPSSSTQFWDYFDKISGDGECSSAMCRECLTIIPMPGSKTSTLTQHLKIAHDIGSFNQEDEHEPEPDSQLGEQDEQDID